MKNYRIKKTSTGYAYKESYLKEAYKRYKEAMKNEIAKGREVNILDKKTFNRGMNEALNMKIAGALGNKTPLQVIKKESYVFETKLKQNRLKKALGIPKSQKLGMNSQQLHRLFAQKITSGEWYAVNGNVYSTVDNSFVY